MFPQSLIFPSYFTCVQRKVETEKEEEADQESTTATTTTATTSTQPSVQVDESVFAEEDVEDLPEFDD